MDAMVAGRQQWLKMPRLDAYEVAGEALAQVQGPVRIICNSDLDPQDLVTRVRQFAPLKRRFLLQEQALALDPRIYCGGTF